MPSHVRRAHPARRLLRATLAVAGGVVLALAAAGSTYAYLSATSTVGGGTITAGSAGFTVTAGSPVSLGGLYPGATVYGTYTLTNIGDVPLALSVSSFTVTTTPTALGSNLVFDLAVQPAGTTCSAATYTQVTRSGSATTGTFTGPLPSRDRYTPGSVAPTRTLCVRATLASGAPDGAKAASGSFAVVIRGVQP